MIKILHWTTLLFLSVMLGVQLAWPEINYSFGIPRQTDVIVTGEYATNDFWDQLNDHFVLTAQYEHPKVQAQISAYLQHAHYINSLAEQAEPYIYFIYQQAIERKIPAELVLIPMVESAYDPFAYSHQGAAGLWQMMPGTASGYGVKQNWWYDGRRDIIASTHAAMDYLTHLAHLFAGDWLLVLAAYDCGEGTVKNAIRHNRKLGKPTDFWSLKLPHETQEYVPRLLALADLIRHAQEYHLDLFPIKNKPYIDVADVGSQIDLAQAAKLAGIDTELLYQLNPGFNRWATDPAGPYALVLPVNTVKTFKKNLANLDEEHRVTWQRHTVKSGDSLIKLAHIYKTSVKLLSKVNRLKNTKIHVGKVLLIPLHAKKISKYVLKAEQKYLTKKDTLPGPQRIVHKVKTGESLWKVAKTYKIKIRQLRFWNQLKPHDSIQPGAELVIWRRVPVHTSTLKAHQTRYKVHAGDSMWGIAKQFKVSVTELTKWNHLSVTKPIYPGQVITLYRT